MHISRHVVACALLAGLVTHFGFTLLHLMPPNVIGLRLRSVLNAYMDPFFSQNWALFAPDPIVDTRELLVSCRIPDGKGGLTETAWSNITTPVREKRAVYRVGPANAIERSQTGPLYVVQRPLDPLIERLARDEKKKYATLVEEYEQERKKAAEIGHRLLRRVGSAACDRLYGKGVTRDVGIRVLATPSPPFSRRREPLSASQTTHFDIPWGAYERVASL